MISNACPSLAQRIISGTSLATNVTTGVVSGAVYGSFGSVDLTSSLVIALSAVATAPLGSLMAHRLPSSKLKRILGYWLLAVAPLIPLKNFLLKGKTQEGDVDPGGGVPQDGAVDPASLAAAAGEAVDAVFRPLNGMDLGLSATGALAGFASGLLGIGEGTIITPALAVFTPISQSSFVATSLVAMILPSLAGLVQHSRLGNVDWKMGGMLALGTCVGSLSSASSAVHAPDFVMEGAFSLGMLFLGYKTLSSLKK